MRIADRRVSLLVAVVCVLCVVVCRWLLLVAVVAVVAVMRCRALFAICCLALLVVLMACTVRCCQVFVVVGSSLFVV